MSFWKEVRICLGGALLVLVIGHLVGLVEHGNFLQEGIALFIGYFSVLAWIRIDKQTNMENNSDS